MERGILSGMLAAAIVALGPSAAIAQGSPGAVYTMTNAADANVIVVYNRAADGMLTAPGMVPTGGKGTGAGLGNQGGVILSPDNRWLFAVNAGSNEISVFAVTATGLTPADRVPSGGAMPVSLTVRGNQLYVLNGGVPNNVTGFTLSDQGKLAPIPDSTRPLSAEMTMPAQVQFSPEGNHLVVTEKATDMIDVFPVGSDGLAGNRVSRLSAGDTPFGFAFGRNNQLFVSEAFPEMPNGSALSSYTLAADGSLQPIHASAPTNQSAACWVVVTDDGNYAYTTNTMSGSITGFRIAANGSLTLLNGDGITARTGEGSRPIDAALTPDSGQLFVLNAGAGSIAGFRVGADGSLAPLNNVTGLPAGTNGLAAR